MVLYDSSDENDNPTGGLEDLDGGGERIDDQGSIGLRIENPIGEQGLDADGHEVDEDGQGLVATPAIHSDDDVLLHLLGGPLARSRKALTYCITVLG